MILADPPWRYEHAPTPTRAIERHYPTMATEDICALPIADIAAADCVLFLWATSPKLPEALAVLAAWGFRYRTNAVWVKPQIGMGYYFRQQHESLLVGARGRPRVPLPCARKGSVISAPRRRHSQKPGRVYDLIANMYPTARKVELFAREPQFGWDSWGNEVACSAALGGAA